MENIRYEKWLDFTDAQKEELSEGWNVYDGEGFNLAIMALSHLVNSSNRKVATAYVGVYHGGRYLLNVTLLDETPIGDVDELSSTFEGFLVVWFNLKNEWMGGFRMGG